MVIKITLIPLLLTSFTCFLGGPRQVGLGVSFVCVRVGFVCASWLPWLCCVHRGSRGFVVCFVVVGFVVMGFVVVCFVVMGFVVVGFVVVDFVVVSFAVVHGLHCGGLRCGGLCCGRLLLFGVVGCCCLV